MRSGILGDRRPGLPGDRRGGRVRGRGVDGIRVLIECCACATLLYGIPEFLIRGILVARAETLSEMFFFWARFPLHGERVGGIRSTFKGLWFRIQGTGLGL